MTERIRIAGAGISGPDVTWVLKNHPGGSDPRIGEPNDRRGGNARGIGRPLDPDAPVPVDISATAFPPEAFPDFGTARIIGAAL
jgi:hypothetical protein